MLSSIKKIKKGENYFFIRFLISFLKYPTPTRHNKRITPIIATSGVLD